MAGRALNQRPGIHSGVPREEDLPIEQLDGACDVLEYQAANGRNALAGSIHKRCCDGKSLLWSQPAKLPIIQQF